MGLLFPVLRTVNNDFSVTDSKNLRLVRLDWSYNDALEGVRLANGLTALPAELESWLNVQVFALTVHERSALYWAERLARAVACSASGSGPHVRRAEIGDEPVQAAVRTYFQLLCARHVHADKRRWIVGSWRFLWRLCLLRFWCGQADPETLWRRSSWDGAGNSDTLSRDTREIVRLLQSVVFAHVRARLALLRKYSEVFVPCPASTGAVVLPPGPAMAACSKSASASASTMAASE